MICSSCSLVSRKIPRSNFLLHTDLRVINTTTLHSVQSHSLRTYSLTSQQVVFRVDSYYILKLNIILSKQLTKKHNNLSETCQNVLECIISTVLQKANLNLRNTELKQKNYIKTSFQNLGAAKYQNEELQVSGKLRQII